MSPSDRKAPDTARLFVALWPDDATRARLAAFADAWRWPPGARRVAAANLHATLHFIGAYPCDAVDSLQERLGRVEPRAIALRAAGTDTWRGGIAVLRLHDDPALTSLHRDIGDALARLGIVRDARPFAPHVTLARKAVQAAPPAELPALDWTAAGFALVESCRGPPARYEPLAAWGRPTLPAA